MSRYKIIEKDTTDEGLPNNVMMRQFAGCISLTQLSILIDTKISSCELFSFCFLTLHIKTMSVMLYKEFSNKLALTKYSLLLIKDIVYKL